MDVVELFIGIAEIAIAMAGFTGVVVAFGSRSDGAWHPGDRLRLNFLLEASMTAAGFSLLALLTLTAVGSSAAAWQVLSTLWCVFMGGSLWRSRRKIRANMDAHADIDRVANRLTGAVFGLVILVQVGNVVVWQDLPAFLVAVISNLAGAAMQFFRLIRSAFHR